ncbi:MAG: MOSC domain-containing protein [Myxococcaceae bacterium]
MNGRAVGLAVCERGQVESSSVLSLSLNELGVIGDRHAGPTLIAGPRQKGVPRGTVLPNTRQVSLVSVEESRAIAMAVGLERLDFTWLAANVELEGLEGFTRTPAGALLEFSGGVVLALEGENEPCRKVGKVMAAKTGRPLESAFVKAAHARRGLIARVQRGGTVTLGEQVRVR